MDQASLVSGLYLICIPPLALLMLRKCDALPDIVTWRYRGKGCSEKSDTRIKPFFFNEAGILGQETGRNVHLKILIGTCEVFVRVVVFEFSPQVAELNSGPDRMQHIFSLGHIPVAGCVAVSPTLHIDLQFPSLFAHFLTYQLPVERNYIDYLNQRPITKS